jgi:myo-inositol-1(or 4)-monophosphatase
MVKEFEGIEYSLTWRKMEEFIKKITLEAGQAVYKKFGELGHLYSKDAAVDVVTKADLLSNKIITEAVAKQYPKDGIISEEQEKTVGSSEHTWIIDPLDGSRNFSTGVPLFGVMVALVKNDEVIMSALYNPCQKDLFFAKKGEGAFKNGKKILCSTTPHFEDSYGVGGGGFGKAKGAYMAKFVNHAKKESFWMNCLASAMIGAIYVSDGRRDWYFSIDSKIWDYAASSLLLKESGCIVTNLEGKPWSLNDDSLVATNKNLHPVLLKILNS